MKVLKINIECIKNKSTVPEDLKSIIGDENEYDFREGFLIIPENIPVLIYPVTDENLTIIQYGSESVYVMETKEEILAMLTE